MRPKHSQNQRLAAIKSRNKMTWKWMANKMTTRSTMKASKPTVKKTSATMRRKKARRRMQIIAKQMQVCRIIYEMSKVIV